MKKEMDKMKKEMKAMINKEMAELKETINEALLEEEDNDDDEENENRQSRGYENSTSTRGRLCAIVPPGHLIAPGWLRKK